MVEQTPPLRRAQVSPPLNRVPEATRQTRNPKVKSPFVSIPVMRNTPSLIRFLLNSVDFTEPSFNPGTRNQRNRSQINRSFSAMKIPAGKHA